MAWGVRPRVWTGYSSDHQDASSDGPGKRAKAELMIVAEGATSGCSCLMLRFCCTAGEPGKTGFDDFVAQLDTEERQKQALFGYIRYVPFIATHCSKPVSPMPGAA